MISKHPLTRRDFLKLASLASLSCLTAPLMPLAKPDFQENLPNILVFVFDAWSAENVSFYGYPRQTMPNLEAFATNAIVYHNHCTAGRYTTPGTASLLSGLYPWTHRAFSMGAGVLKQHQDKNIFALLSEKYATLGYTQNKFADVFLDQFNAHLDAHIPSGAFNYEQRDFYTSLFHNDPQIAFSSFDDNIVRDNYGFDASLFLGPLLRSLHLREREVDEAAYRLGYPFGLPETNAREYFSLPNVVDGAIDILRNIKTPTFAYLHFYPPHGPYRATKKFNKSFRGQNAWEPAEKPVHPRSETSLKYSELLAQRHRYDDFLASWDNEVARLFAFIREAGYHENSYVIITSDHGEMFERGVSGHVTRLLYQPLIHIPLLISCPGQTERKDVYEFTSSVDILPTVARMTGLPIPDWVEGEPLAGLGGPGDDKRSIYTVDAENNSSFKRMTSASISLTKGYQRLTCYKDPDSQQFEFYDLEADPEELNDLYPSQPVEAMRMQEEMLQKMAESDRPFKG